jgi:hypothetical protein
MGLESVSNWLERRGWRAGSYVLVGVVLLASLGFTARDYFVRYRTHPGTRYAFEDAAAQLAAEVNDFLGTGWDGVGVRASFSGPRVDRRVYLDRRLVDEWASTAFLIPATERVTLFRADPPPSPSEATLIIFWPHSGLERYVNSVPRNARITAHAGPLTRGDLEEVPYTSYVSYMVEPDAMAPTGYVARFGEAIALTDYAVRRRGGTWEVELEWMALVAPGDDYTVSVHLFDGDQPLAQHDAEPCDGTYPTRLWREGDVVVDRHLLDIPEDDPSDPSLTVGVYGWPTMERLEASDSDGDCLGPQVPLSTAELWSD